ncbi:hypothetical protein [Burkholderia contaminans]|nr:hypothetical protein [Burkholderia contaminans]
MKFSMLLVPHIQVTSIKDEKDSFTTYDDSGQPAYFGEVERPFR